jgi:uncharacterized membrane protein HdeD (DUF308 family)
MFNFTPSITRGQAALRGFLALAIGVVFLSWPNISIGTAVVLFAICAFTDAVIALTRLFSSGAAAGDRILQLLRTVVDLAAAVVAIAYPGPTAEALTIIIGVYFILAGVLELSGSSTVSRLGLSGSGWLAVSGLLSIATGILLIVWPGIGAVTLAIVVGAYLAVYGATYLISAAKAPKGGTVASPLAS